MTINLKWTKINKQMMLKLKKLFIWEKNNN